MYSLLWLHLYISLQLLVLPCHVQKVIIKKKKKKKKKKKIARNHPFSLFVCVAFERGRVCMRESVFVTIHTQTTNH